MAFISLTEMECLKKKKPHTSAVIKRGVGMLA